MNGAPAVARIAAIIKQEMRKAKGIKNFRPRINAMCIDCNYDPLDQGNWRQQIERCQATDCPLYQVRPTSNQKGRK